TRGGGSRRRDQQGARRRLRHARPEEPDEARGHERDGRRRSAIHTIRAIYLLIKNIEWTAKTTMAYTALACFFRLKNSMSNRRFQRALDTAADGREAGPRASRLILNVVVVSIIIAVAIIPARLADWMA